VYLAARKLVYLAARKLFCWVSVPLRGKLTSEGVQVADIFDDIGTTNIIYVSSSMFQLFNPTHGKVGAVASMHIDHRDY